MTVKQIITQVSGLLSERVDEAVLLAWFNEIEMMIQMQLFGIARADAVQYTQEQSEAKPIAVGQYERVYSYWLLAKGYAKLQNQSGYTRYRKLYIAEYAAFRKWVLRTHGTAEVPENGKGVYLSAYGIACKHGFVGSEAEWLASLHGKDGADGLRGPQGEPGKDGADAAQYDLQYDGVTHTLQLTKNGQSIRSFDLTQHTSTLSIKAEQTEFRVTLKESVPLCYTWSTTAGGKGSATYTVNGRQVATATVEQGEVCFDTGEYLQAGVNRITVAVRDAYSTTGVQEFTVTAIAIGLTAAFSDSEPFYGEITFRYTPVGACPKTIYFVLNGEMHGSFETSLSGRQFSYVIPALPHGHHTLEVYACAVVGEREVRTESLHYDLICLSEGDSTPIIASAFCQQSAVQYQTLRIPFIVYVPGVQQATVEVYEDESYVKTLQVTPVRQTYAYVCRTTGAHSVMLRCGQVTRRFHFVIIPSDVDAAVQQQDLVLWLDAAGRSNGEQDPAVWEYTDAKGNVTQAAFSGFGWKTDGWIEDAQGSSVLHVPVGGNVSIPVQPFAHDVRVDGITIEVVLAARDVVNYDSVVLDCFTDRGLEIRARQAGLYSEQSSVLCSFGEEQIVHLCFVVESRNDQRLVHAYVNGVDSGVLQYAAGDSFTQSQPEQIVLGCADCAVDVYTVRVYGAALSRHAVLDHFIASTPDPALRNDRYDRNRVYDEYGNIVPSSVPLHLPYLILRSDSLPQYKGDMRICSGSYVDGQDLVKSFTFSNAEADVQGTSSQYYAVKNFKIAFKEGFVGLDGLTKPTYALTEQGVETDTFCFKADVASSEGANNVVLVDLYCHACPFETKAQQRDARVRQGIAGRPILLFWENAKTGEVTFQGKYNFNHDKSTPEVFGFDREKYPRQQSWEFCNNTSDRVLFRSADFSDENWKNDFEARFPKGLDDPSDLVRVIGWVASCDPQKATGRVLAGSVEWDGVSYTHDTVQYRLAKFRAEVRQYFDLTDLLWYYLFTELFLMIDSRAKNMFLTTDDGLIWYFLPYDFDTSLGINNEGLLRFSCDLEDTDCVGQSDVYNGQDSVLWNCVRRCFARELQEMYAAMRNANHATYLGKDEVLAAFDAHQKVWGEAVFNEDCYQKYLAPLINSQDASYLPMAQGSKSAQRQGWVEGRFFYLDSKYVAGDILGDHAVIRGYAKQDFSLTPYTNMYLAVRYGSYTVRTRAERGESYTLPCPLDNVNDTEIILYGASRLSDIGDISGFYPGYVDLSAARGLVHLHIGSGQEGYTNSNLTHLSLGSNHMLRTIDVQNCPMLSQPLSLQGCPSIREVYAKGSGITAVDLPTGGNLRVLQLPASLRSLCVQDHANLQDFSVEGLEQLHTLRLENVPIDAVALMAQAPMLERVRLIGVEWELYDCALLDRLCSGEIKGLTASGAFLDTPVLTGTAYLVEDIDDETLAAYAAALPELTLIIALGIMDCEGRFVKDRTGCYILPPE